mgnify:CR=1 FL=1
MVTEYDVKAMEKYTSKKAMKNHEGKESKKVEKKEKKMKMHKGMK